MSILLRIKKIVNTYDVTFFVFVRMRVSYLRNAPYQDKGALQKKKRFSAFFLLAFFVIYRIVKSKHCLGRY